MKVRGTTTTITRITNDLIDACMLIENLNELGYSATFGLAGTGLLCHESGKIYQIIDLIVDDIFLLERFDAAMSDYVIYTVRARDNSVKGIFSAYPVPPSLHVIDMIVQ